jgi:hypothetical protein
VYDLQVMEEPLPMSPTYAERLLTHFEDEVVYATLLHFLRLGKQLDPFSNGMLAVGGAALIYMLDKGGSPSAVFGRGLSLGLVLLLALSIGAGFLSRLMSLQGLVMAHQWENPPWEIERLRKEYRTTAGRSAVSLDGHHIIKEVRAMLRWSGPPSGIWKVMNRAVERLAGGEPLDLSQVNPRWHGLAIAAHGVGRVLPLVIAQTFFLILAILCALAGLAWSVV